MRFSDERISHLAHLVSEGIWRDDLVDFTDDVRALKEIKDVIRGYLSREDHADATARLKIQSLSRDVPEGSKEWDVLYRQYLEEELSKKNF